MNKIFIVTLFPELFKPFWDRTLLAKSANQFEFEVIDLKDCSPKSFKGVDEAPYGGGNGVVMRADVLKTALDKIGYNQQDFHVVYTSPRGQQWQADLCKNFAQQLLDKPNSVFICGRYEGIDERFIQKYVDEIYSIGDYVLMGGELAVLVMLESSLRFVPNILGNKNSAHDDSFENNLLECPQYTKPQEFEGEKVPAVLLSGNHQKIAQYRREEALRITKQHRPDLLDE